METNFQNLASSGRLSDALIHCSVVFLFWLAGYGVDSSCRHRSRVDCGGIVQMTSKLTREENVQAVFDLKAGYTLGLADVETLKRVARMALAEMDSEPVFTLEVARADYKGQKLGNQFGFITLDAERNLKEGSYQLYRHAQPSPVVPDAYVRDERGRMMLNGVCEPKIGFSAGWNACRSAMLQESQKSAGASNNCRSSENVQVVQDVSRCSTKAAPALDSPPKTAESRGGNSPVIPDGSEWTNEQCLEFLTVAFRHNEISGDIEFDDIRLGVKFALSAAPQEVNHG